MLPDFIAVDHNGPKEFSLKKIHSVFIVFAIALFCITAYYSKGYHHPDEHYQIIEFARYKLGLISGDDLPWEFKAQIRSSLQPLIFAFFLKLMTLIHIDDPNSQVFIMRILTGVFSVFCISYFVKYSLNSVGEKYKVAYLILSYFLWFIPFVSVRFSSETWSALFFVLAVATVLKNKRTKANYFLIGIFIGVSFLFRYQAATLSVGLFLWLAIVQKAKIADLGRLISAVFIIMICGVLLDGFFYGKFSIVFWNYFNVNLIKGVASSFGISPWYTVLKYICKDTIWLIGLAIFLSLIILIFYRPKSIFIWCVLPFIVIHALIPHKELRFMFPVVYFAPIIMILAAEIVDYRLALSSQKVGNYFTACLLLFMLFVNIIGLVIIATQPAGDGGKEVTNYIYQNYRGSNARFIYFRNSNPFKPYPDLKESFYKIENLPTIRMKNIEQFYKENWNDDTIQIVAVKIRYLDSTNFKSNLLRSDFSFVIPEQPRWRTFFKRFYGIESGKQPYVLLVRSPHSK